MLAARSRTARWKWLGKATPSLIKSPGHPSVAVSSKRFAWGLSDDPPMKESKESKRWFPPPQKAVSHARTGAQPESTTKQEFYDWFLLKTEFRKGHAPGPCAWVKSLKWKALNDSINSYPELQIDPLRVFDLSDATPDLVLICLELFVASNQETTAIDHHIVPQYSSAQPGTKGLIWLGQKWKTVDITQHPILLRLITFCVTAEGRDDVVVRWLNTEENLPESDLSASRTTPWKQLLFRDYIEATHFWHGINNAIKAFFNCLDTRLVDSNGIRVFNTNYASTFIYQQIWHNSSDQVEVQLFENFASWFNRAINMDNAQHDHNVAQLALIHPSKPDALPAYRFIMKYATATGVEQTLFAEDLFYPKDRRGATLLFWFVVRAAQQLHRQGLQEESHQILDLGATKLPRYFVPNQRQNSHAHLNRSRGLRADMQGRSFEHLDNDGYIKSGTKVANMFKIHANRASHDHPVD